MSATNGVSRRVDSPLTCEYDGAPRRPECEHIAVVAYGPIALCASCNLRRSTVGKGISNYSAAELRRVKGLKSADVREVLPRASEEAVHRDYFVLA